MDVRGTCCVDLRWWQQSGGWHSSAAAASTIAPSRGCLKTLCGQKMETWIVPTRMKAAVYDTVNVAPLARCGRAEPRGSVDTVAGSSSAVGRL